ncbi:MAG: pentapeptide repeat-containing protein [Hyphomicrobiales bacterium]|nr:pentapeptide repeat-containing protein [Hyphomicrobiales bacterium]
MKSLLGCTVFTGAIVFSLAYGATVFAWTANTEKLARVNSQCKMEPDAQCTSAVRTGVSAPGVNMNHASMEKMRLDGAKLQRANFSYAIMQLINLKGADLMLANLENAHLHAANLQKANLMLANMQNVNLLDADMRGANLQGANLTGAILIQAKLEGATWTDGRVCAAGSVGKCL